MIPPNCLTCEIRKSQLIPPGLPARESEPLLLCKKKKGHNARLGEKERHTRFQGKHQNIVELVLQLACLRLFTHLHSRHKTRSWIRNTSSIDSDVLAALDLDRRLMREQDEAFTEALMADQKKGSASSAENDLGEAQTEEAEERKEAVQPEPAKTMTREEIRAARLAALEKRLNK